MDQHYIILLLLLGVGFLGVSIFVRARFGEVYELRTMDLALLVLPLLMVAIATGKIKMFDAFGVRADISDLFTDAATKEIDRQVASPITPSADELINLLETAAKTGVGQIPRLIENKTQGLEFRLGHGGYYGPAIQAYFKNLYSSSYLQYLIIKEKDDTLFGVYDALDLAVYFRSFGENTYDKFAAWLNQANSNSRRELSLLPGFISVGQAMSLPINKREALKQMDALRANRWPVINQQKQFIGTIERSQLMASMILEVTAQLENQ